MASVQESSEQKQTTASFILQFYNHLNLLSHHYAVYLNLLIFFENKFKSDDLDKSLKSADPGETTTLLEQIQTVRYYAHLTYLEYCSINIAQTKQPKKEIKEAYDKIKTTFVIGRDDLESFINQINEFLLTSVMQDLLKSSQDIVNSIYNH